MSAPGSSAASSSALPAALSGSRSSRAAVRILGAVAVVAVLLGEAGLLPAGRLGVDVLFVLTGFLAADLAARGIAAGTFSLRRYALGWAARLLPALFAMLAVTTALAPFLLPPAAYAEFRADLLGALTLSSNLVRFAYGAQGNVAEGIGGGPLFHTYALSLAGQFLLLFPLVLLLTRRWWGATLLVLALLSAGFAAALAAGLTGLPDARAEAAALLLLPARAYPFLFGAAAAVLFARRGALPVPLALMLGAALLTLLALPSVPGPGASVAACLLAALLCAGLPVGLARLGAARVVARLGTRSYAIFLIAGPLLAYAAVPFGDAMPAALRLAVLALAVVLGGLLLRLVEAPARAAARSAPRHLASRLAGAGLACALLGLAVIAPLAGSYPRHLFAGASPCGSPSACPTHREDAHFPGPTIRVTAPTPAGRPCAPGGCSGTAWFIAPSEPPAPPSATRRSVARLGAEIIAPLFAIGRATMGIHLVPIPLAGLEHLLARAGRHFGPLPPDAARQTPTRPGEEPDIRAPAPGAAQSPAPAQSAVRTAWLLLRPPPS